MAKEELNKNQLMVMKEVSEELSEKNNTAKLLNMLGSDEKRLRFLSCVMDSVQRLPALLDCSKASIINSFIKVAELKFLPSSVSGEAFVLPYSNHGALEAQFQLGIQGIITLLYRAGAKSIVSEHVREKDVFSIVNGSIHHEVNPLLTKEERGEKIGTYAIIYLSTGGKIEKFMRKEDILKIGMKYSKSYNTKFSPWKEENDPDGFMEKKTVLKQCSKLAPKNEELNRALSLDNQDSIISDRIKKIEESSNSLVMGALETDNNLKKENGKEINNEEDKGKGKQEPAPEDNEEKAGK